MEEDDLDTSTVVLDGVSTQSFALGSFVGDTDKSSLQMVKFSGGKIIDNYVVPLSVSTSKSTLDPNKLTPAVDPNTLTKTSLSTTRLVSLSNTGALRRTKPISSSEDETIHVMDSGRQGEVPVTVIQDALGNGTRLIGTLPSSLGVAGDAPCTVSIPIVSVSNPNTRVTDATIGSVPGSIGNVTECLRIVQSTDSLMSELPCSSSAETVTLSSVASNSAIAGFQDALHNATATIGPISTTISQDSISALAGTSGATTLQDLGVVVTSSAGSAAATLGTLTLSNSVHGMTGTLGTETDVVGSLTGSVPVETVSLVNISVPNVELTTSGQLLISQGSLVYAQQGNNLVAVPSHMVDGGQLTAQAAAPTVVTAEPKKKNKGGWPKGKKRKVDPLKEANAPRKPTSAYTLFLNEQRPKLKKKSKDMHFSEMTKVLGNQWSGMAQEDKQKYFAAADNDKKRYIDELKAYQQTETYQALIKRQIAKKLKTIVGNNADQATLDSDVSNSMLSELQLDDDDPSDLFCRTCDQYFSSVHNKKEHIYGKQHLVTLSLKLCEIEKETEQIENQAFGIDSVTNPPPPLDTNTDLTAADLPTDLPQDTRSVSEPVNIEQFKDDFVELNYDRELEIRELHKHQQECMDFNLQLSKQLKDFQDVADKLEGDLKNLKAIGSSLQAQLDGLRMVPTLFGVINF
ncbi:uncharacterized protein [Amphiura filiformis]|uniref:uncharacterized protein n=1 Tax=Amphiura filiformis TaxID=82378 RepID=UPI003B20E2A3